MRSARPFHYAVLPPTTDRYNPPSLLPYFLEYWKERGNGARVPRWVDGVTAGAIHQGSRVEVLYLDINIETWWQVAHWLHTNYNDQVVSANKARLYFDLANRRQRWRFRSYLVIASSPYESKEYLKNYANDFLKKPVDDLLAERRPPAPPQPIILPAPIAVPMPPAAAPLKFKPLPLPPRPQTRRAP